MANKFRYISGDIEPTITGPVDSATVIAIGDFVNASPAPIVNAAGAAGFLGVSGQQSRDGDTFRLRVSVRGRYEHPVTPDTFEIGDLVAPAGPQLLVKTTNPAEAIGRCVAQYTEPTNLIEWRIMTKVMAGT